MSELTLGAIKSIDLTVASRMTGTTSANPVSCPDVHHVSINAPASAYLALVKSPDAATRVLLRPYW